MRRMGHLVAFGLKWLSKTHLERKVPSKKSKITRLRCEPSAFWRFFIPAGGDQVKSRQKVGMVTPGPWRKTGQKAKDDHLIGLSTNAMVELAAYDDQGRQQGRA